MKSLCEGLVRGGDKENAFGATPHFKTMVGSMEWLQGGGWRLFDREKGLLGEFDWLCISASGTCHPRWSKTFGGAPPMVAAAAALADQHLDSALAHIAQIENRPVTVSMMAFTGEAGKAWAAIPWAVADLLGDPHIHRIVVNPLPDGTVTVVVNSTHQFADGVVNVHGATSTAARLGGANSASDREQEIVQQLWQVVRQRLVPEYISEEHFSAEPVWGPHLHRWGAAFPSGHGLPAAQALVPSARVLFCGDFVGDNPTGRVEDAALSGLAAADALVACLAEPKL